MALAITFICFFIEGFVLYSVASWYWLSKRGKEPNDPLAKVMKRIFK